MYFELCNHKIIKEKKTYITYINNIVLFFKIYYYDDC